MRDKLPYLLALLVMLGIMTCGVVVRVSNYDECRSKGFSAVYCATGR